MRASTATDLVATEAQPALKRNATTTTESIGERMTHGSTECRCRSRRQPHRTVGVPLKGAPGDDNFTHERRVYMRE